MRRKNKKILIPSLALALLLLLSGCAESTKGSDETAQNSNTAAQPPNIFNTEEKGEISEEESVIIENSTEEMEQTAEEDLPPDESLFEYYDLLNEEYEKYGVNSPWLMRGAGQYYFSSKENTIIIYYKNEVLLSYNIENKTKNAVLEPIGANRVICNDIMYYDDEIIWKGNIYERKYDGTSITKDDGQTLDSFNFNGDETWDNIHDIYIVAREGSQFVSQPDGTLFIHCLLGQPFTEEAQFQYFMISPDRKTFTQLPKPEIEVEHGFIEERDYKILACYNNKLFVDAEDIGFCCIDTDNLTWEKIDLDISSENLVACKSIGRYLLFDTIIYDMETKEVLVHNENFPASFAGSYFGGKYNVERMNGKWYFLRCTSDGSEVDLKYFESYDLTDKMGFSNTVTPITDKYYIYKDDYGYFLRTYENGADKEETIWLKDEIENLTF